ncbi:pseudouridine-5-phosphate glycosidase, partial [Acinetobacter baumannii]|nr:pseudouridine-5-phosphate glycosidase [Acinetobacter baumannii]
LEDSRRGGVPMAIVAVSEPKIDRLPRALHGLRLLILNLGELAARAGRELATDADIAAACAELQGDGVQDVIVTRGAHGVM